ILDRMLPLLRRLIGEDIDLATAVAPEAGTVRVDPAQIEQVVMNLVVNARDAMPDGGRILIEVDNDRITPDEAASYPYIVHPGRYVRLSVSDTGSGMDEEVLNHVFEPFFTTKEQGKGTGLGLATLYGIVKQSGGYVWARSEPGRGSRFDIYLPRVGERAGTEPDVQPGPPPEGGRGETILLVEDEDGVRDLARRVLEKNGYRVLEAADPAAALELMSESPAVDLLLTDVVMPGMSGGELAEHLRRSRPGLPTLFTSGYTEDEIVRRGIVAGEAMFLKKPFTPNELLEHVRLTLQGAPIDG
ncbi:MAG: ATP-binding protein, partial [Gemmatimonadota bacterium]